eukprot:CAMPEP_0181020278 /NCGR_PEP_ID=MMETSP1070-20121207/362_1 /TAXON_ID=265543 /ORGANISM="Minutocellus polymorphus, Strain NH13" /LENGTH=185 /DNA_ID=CAMNT_0023097075 /DNA_START=37 /DNA_END=594 /DNA_ORIENTATION=-
MKSAAVFLALVATASAFNAPMMATRAVGKKKTAPAAEKSAPPESKGYPSFRDAAEAVKFGSISGGGNKAPTPVFIHPTSIGEQKEYDPALFAEAAKGRKAAAFRGITGEYVIDDGLTDLERKQRTSIPMFLSGSARSQKDVSSIRDDIEVDELIFGLDPDRFQLLFIAVFGLFTLVGSLSGNLNL